MKEYLPYIAMAPFVIFVGIYLLSILQSAINAFGMREVLIGTIGFFLIASSVFLFAWGASRL